MEDLVTEIDEQNKDDWTSPPPRLAAPECQQDRLTESIHHRNRFAVMSIEPAHDPEPDIPAEDVKYDDDDAGTARLSMEETLRKYISNDSELANSIRQRESRLWIIDDTDNVWPVSHLDLDRVRIRLGMSAEGGIVLFIQDINLEWCKKLCAKYPEVLSPQILAEHVIRLDKLPPIHGSRQSIEGCLTLLYPGATIECSCDYVSIQMKHESTQPNANGFHFDMESGMPSIEVRKLRQEVFSRHAFNTWKRSSSRMTCVQLEENAHLTLVLVDSEPHLEESHDESLKGYINPCRRMLTVGYDETGTGFSAHSRLPPTQPFWLGPIGSFASSFVTLFKRHTLQSIFNPHSLPLLPSEATESHNRLNRRIIVWLLSESSWWSTVEALEQQVQHLRKEATFVAGHRAFKSLTDFRRQLADAKWLLDDTQWEVETGIKSSRLYWDVDGRALSAEEFWSEKREAPMVEELGRAKSIDVRDIPDLLKELEGRISTMTQTVNEEIQIVVGSVQVEDARIMKRQTEWTVVLAVLAAIYLPMSLVTGIFGMNITDLSADISAPDKWTVVRTWAVIFGTTMASILVYALVRLILRYWRISRMLLRRRIEEIHDGRLSTRIFIFGQRIENLWLYRKIHGFWQKMREWDLEAQKIEKLE